MAAIQEKHCACVKLAHIIGVLQYYFSDPSPFDRSDRRFHDLVDEIVLKKEQCDTWEKGFIENLVAYRHKERPLSDKQKAVILRIFARYVYAQDIDLRASDPLDDAAYVRYLTLED